MDTGTPRRRPQEVVGGEEVGSELGVRWLSGRGAAAFEKRPFFCSF